MANYNTLISAIQSVIAANGNNEITGNILQQTLVAMIGALGGGYQFGGIATPETTPGTPDEKIFYLGSSGTYPNFGPAVIPSGNMGVFYYDSSWHVGTIEFPIGEGTITKANLSSALLNQLLAGFVYAGKATPTGNPGTLVRDSFFLTTTPGTYTNYGNLAVQAGEIAVLRYTVANNTWSKESIEIPEMVQVVNNLTDGGIDKALSAEMGKKIADFIGPMEDSQTPLTLTWAQGSIDINTGENIAAQVTLRSGFAVGGLNDKIRFVCNAGYFIKAVQAYNSANVSDFYGTLYYGYENGAWDTTKTDLTISPNGKYLRVCMGRTDLGNIQVAEGSNTTCYRVTTSLGATIVESIEDIFEIINGSGIFPEYTFVDSDYVIVNANIRSTTNVWDTLANYNSALLDVTAFRNKEIYIDCNGGYYAFLTAGYTGPGTTPAYAAGYSQQIVLPNSGIMRLRVPYDAVYLYVMILNNNVDSKPYSIRVGSTLKEDNILLDNLKLLSAPLIKNKPGYYLNATGGEVQASVADIIEYVPVKEGDIFNYRGYTGALGAAVIGYNSNKTFVSLLLPYGNYLDSVNVVIPSGISYVSFSGRSDYFAFEVRKFIKYADAQQLFNILTFGGNLAGKKLSVISDSITQGVVSGNATPPGEIWVDIVARNLQMELTNYGISGSTIAVAEGNGGMFASLEDLQAAQKEAGKYYTVLTGNQTYQVYYWNGTSLTTSTRKLRTPVSQRYEFMNDDADVIIVWAGSNDFQYNWTPVGTMEDRTNDTFYGALHSLCLGLLSKYLAKPIVFMTPIKRAQTNLDTAADTVAHRGGSYGTPDSKNLFNLTLGDYGDIIKEVCAYYSIPVIDLYSNSILNPAIDSQLSLFDDWKTHPLQKGHEIIARYVLGQLKTIISF